ncbi:TetR/AcrR family transcriptional regulator [Methanobacterium sp.]|uniref:TetR/AcrR family transcriptional regulator n=1 Tax=Methanobacterium sp. TaxID=2164 RepID=UPI002ABBA070|nr:TetR/AcrR family transcriptional regulator [Methanobacterium sp.]MDY9923178.1 TetR/AcrR family transcriptional regulator [Methanobacterium sp.]
MVDCKVDKTEQKILDAALKLFSEKGYAGATTKIIAAKAGFTEMTLYTKFKTKQNLFDLVMIYGMKKLNEDASTILFVDKEFEDPLDFLETYVRNLEKFIWNNFEFFKLGFNQERKISEQFLMEGSYDFGKYIEKHLPNQKIDYMAFALSIFSFVYMYDLGKYQGRQDTSIDNILDKFIHNLSLSIQ